MNRINYEKESLNLLTFLPVTAPIEWRSGASFRFGMEWMQCSSVTTSADRGSLLTSSFHENMATAALLRIGALSHLSSSWSQCYSSSKSSHCDIIVHWWSLSQSPAAMIHSIHDDWQRCIDWWRSVWYTMVPRATKAWIARTFDRIQDPTLCFHRFASQNWNTSRKCVWLVIFAPTR